MIIAQIISMNIRNPHTKLQFLAYINDEQIEQKMRSNG